MDANGIWKEESDELIMIPALQNRENMSIRHTKKNPVKYPVS